MGVEQLELIQNKMKLGVLKIETVQPSLSCNWLTHFIIQDYSWTFHQHFSPTGHYHHMFNHLWMTKRATLLSQTTTWRRLLMPLAGLQQ